MPSAPEHEKSSIFDPAPVRRAGTWDGPDRFYVTDNCYYEFDRLPRPPPTLLDNRLMTPICKAPPKGGGDFWGREKRGEVHVPKASRSLREFAVEFMTIVVGIVIAISPEQAVETIHWHEKVKIARTLNYLIVQNATQQLSRASASGIRKVDVQSAEVRETCALLQRTAPSRPYTTY